MSVKKIIRYILVLPFAIVLAYWLAGKYGDRMEEPLRNLLFAAKGDSIPNYAQEVLDENGIPFVIYATENGITPGKQYNATIVANYALQYAALYDSLHQEKDLQSFFHCWQWLQKEAVSLQDAKIYQYTWRQAWYPAIPAPYTSGMTSGLVLQVLVKAQSYKPDSSNNTLAKQLIKGCFIPIDSGGFTIQEPQGWWYEELAAPSIQTPRILDGHIFTVLGLLRYRNARQDTLAAIAAEMGLQSLRYYLPKYDAGNGNMYYDAQGKQADRKYKRVITTQLDSLFVLTGDSLYYQYLSSWKKPMQRHYMQRVYAEGNKTGWLFFLALMLSVWLILFLLLKTLVLQFLTPKKR